ncbi:MAG: SGNH/GDSL hydrolase family protein [Planctomycetes bacterium]|nr:SGNH/GDSL hydrolase family protein [Planctomycetota bacterium]
MTGLIVAASFFALLALAEVYARFVIGLGDPPLWIEDREIEYLPQPSKSYRRFGNRISYNAYSMRSRDFPRSKSDPAEVRVLVVGDSIVQGGSNTDQDALATTLLEKRLSDALGRPVVVGNISAASWGPPNFLAYLKRFGLLEADVVAIVVNSEDYADAPTFDPLDARRPQHKPRLALQDLYERYIAKRIVRSIQASRVISPLELKECLDALREVIRMARASGASVVLAQYLKRSELESKPEIGYHEIARVAKELGIEPVQLGEAFARALEAGSDPYRDGNHPNDRGQQIIAEWLFDPIQNAFSARER